MFSVLPTTSLIVADGLGIITWANFVKEDGSIKSYGKLVSAYWLVLFVELFAIATMGYRDILPAILFG